MTAEQGGVTLVATKKFLGIRYGREVAKPGDRAHYHVTRGRDVFDVSAEHGKLSDVVRVLPGDPNPVTGIVTETRKNNIVGTFPPEAKTVVDLFTPQVGTIINRGWGRTVHIKGR